MLPDIWGKHLWYSIHFIALDYPEQPSTNDRENYRTFFENLWKVIPCYKCSRNYQDHLRHLPLVSDRGDYLASRDTLFAWTVELHNMVNRMLGKPEMGLDNARLMYSPSHFPTIMQQTVCDHKEVVQPSLIPPTDSTSRLGRRASLLLGFLLGVILVVLVWVWSSSKAKYLKK